MPRRLLHRRLGVLSVMALALLASGIISRVPRTGSDSRPEAQVMMGGDFGMTSGTFSSMGTGDSGTFGTMGTFGMSSTGGNNSSMDGSGGGKGGSGGGSIPPTSSTGGTNGDLGDTGIFGGMSSEQRSSQGGGGSSAAGSSIMPQVSSSAPRSSSAAPASSTPPSSTPLSSSRAPSSSGLSSLPPPPSSSSAGIIHCGDGKTEGTEICDPCAPPGRNATDANCNAVCAPGRCGDGFLDRRRGEECDYVGLVYDPLLPPSFERDESTFQKCASDAACQDGYCLYGKCWPLRWIAYWGWTDTATCPQTWTPLPAWTPSTPPPGVPCNDFTDPKCREFSGDGCTISCKLERCGDRIVQAGYTSPSGKHYGLSEQCDDGNTVSGDGCSDRCLLETASSQINLPPGSSSASSLFSLCDQFPHLCVPISVASSASSTSSLVAFQYSFPAPASSVAPSSAAPSSASALSVAPPSAACGDGRIDAGEECDDGSRNSNTVPGACRLNCKRAFCGDFVADYTLGELCDQGTGNSATIPDRCRLGCVLPRCGDGVVDRTEDCDDGNLDAGDGCSTFCTWESISVIETRCGDGRIQTGESCDDGNTLSGDGCSSQCQTELVLGQWEEINPVLVAGGIVCGDGIRSPGEECDDGNAIPGDGCTPLCKLEAPVCGNGIVEGNEQCDPPGEACDAHCVILQPKPAAPEPLPPPLPVPQPYAFVALPPMPAPVADTGPAALAVMASGAAGALGWMRRRSKKKQ